MKALKFLLPAISMIALNIASAQNSEAGKTEKPSIEKLIRERNFVFKAQSAIPLGRRTIQLTSEYDLKVNGDTMIAYLPYFGRAYVAPIDPSKGGINFTTASFEYTLKEGKKGSWKVSIKPNDTRDVQQMFLRTSDNGYASLQVTSNNRQAISFNGYIKEREK